MKISEKGSIKTWIRKLQDLESIDFETAFAMELALEAAFNKTQTNVHVITGKLKLSGRSDSDYDKTDWVGTITYGGEGSDAPYAVYEIGREGIRPDWVHKPHDPFLGVEEDTAKIFEKAFDKHFRNL